MKLYSKRTSWYLLLIFAFAFPGFLSGQESCKVLKQGIDSIYLGACKKELAHGVGEAWGIDHYFGEFKKGLPHGKGTYEYRDGSVYVGDFSKGLRHGMGEYRVKLIELDTVQKGRWERDLFVGEITSGTDYTVIRSLNIDRYKVVRTTDEKRVFVRINTNFSSRQEIFELSIKGSSGQDFSNGATRGFDNVSFPFILDVRYIKFNRLGNGVMEAIFEIEITKPGEWRIELN